MDLRSLGSVAQQRIEIKDFIRSRWIAHHLKLEEGHQLRCDWYREQGICCEDCSKGQFGQESGQAEAEIKIHLPMRNTPTLHPPRNLHQPKHERNHQTAKVTHRGGDSPPHAPNCRCRQYNSNAIHCNLKLSNPFLSKTMNIKVGDFGPACPHVHSTDEKRKTICGTPNYIVLIVIEGNKEKCGHSFEVVIWSMGVICSTMLVGKSPMRVRMLRVHIGEIIAFRRGMLVMMHDC
ncbi:hypothetical protein ACHAXR_001982 [Thalassiosira sp. AJA248-18]